MNICRLLEAFGKSKPSGRHLQAVAKLMAGAIIAHRNMLWNSREIIHGRPSAEMLYHQMPLSCIIRIDLTLYARYIKRQEIKEIYRS